LRVTREPRLGVAHRGERLRVVLRAPIALAVDERITEAERLRHVRHRFVARRLAVRMELADHVADGAGGFFRLRARTEAELAHRVDDPALHRLQAVADVRQRAIEDHVHRVIEVRLLRECSERHALDAVEIELLLPHPLTSPKLRRGSAQYTDSSPLAVTLD